MRSASLIASTLVPLALALLAPASSGAGDRSLVLVPEMERPGGILYQDREARVALRSRRESEPALGLFRERAIELWPSIRRVDLLALSRVQVESTRGYSLPDRPGPFSGAVIGRELNGRLHLELRGPRLPTKYDIVHRYLYLYTVYDPSRSSFGETVVTIRGWVLE